MGARRLRNGEVSWAMGVYQLSMRERRRRDLVGEGGTKDGHGDDEVVGR